MTSDFHLVELPATDPQAQALMEELNQHLAGLSGDSGASSFDAAALAPGRGLFVVARDAEGRGLGCGALRPLGPLGPQQPQVAELKRMYARAGTRGVGSAVLAHLERAAQRLGYRALWLETRRINSRALHFYQRRGYAQIENFGPYAGRPDAICLGKDLECHA